MLTKRYNEMTRQAEVIENHKKNQAVMKPEQQLSQINQVIYELEAEMWYNIHADAPHQAHKVKCWIDTLKNQAKVLNVQINTQKDQTVIN